MLGKKGAKLVIECSMIFGLPIYIFSFLGSPFFQLAFSPHPKFAKQDQEFYDCHQQMELGKGLSRIKN